MELKRKLATLKSPLMGDLMQFLRELMKDYKNEIQEILAADRQLMAEIEFDLKRFELQEKAEASRQSIRVERSLPASEVQNPAQPCYAADEDQPSNSQNEIEKDLPVVTPGPVEEEMLSDKQLESPVSNVSDVIPPVAVESVAVESVAVEHLAAEPVAVTNDPHTFLIPPSGLATIRKKKRATEHDSNLPPTPNTDALQCSKQPRIMSTPIKENAATDITFNLNDDMSIIPHAEPKKNKRRRL